MTPADGPGISLSQSLAGGGLGRTILLRTDGALYQVGDAVTVQVLVPGDAARVFLDAIHAGRTVATETVAVEDGVGTWTFVADHTMVGALQVHGYYLGADSEIVRDEQLVYVEAADALTVTLTADKEQYLPGEPAAVEVAVADAAGLPKVAALGVQVVDEAVFALQEMQPGLLEVYFELEEALSTPRFQFSWPELTPTSIVEEDVPREDDTLVSARERRAEVAFAAQDGGGAAYGIDLNTQKTRLAGVLSVLRPLVRADADRMVDEAAELVDAGVLSDANAAEYVAGLDELDFWGRPYHFVPDGSYRWDMTTDGPDEVAGTADDITVSIEAYDFMWGKNGDMWMRGDGGPMPGAPTAGMDGGEFAGGGQVPPPEPGDPNSGGGQQTIRVRSYFPETLFVDPSVITDASGRAMIDLDMADSITTWRMSALANSADGLLGSTTAGLTVFQDFFVDIDFPATLTRGDQVSVPVAIYNYLDIPQTVVLTAENADWVRFLNGGTVTVPLDPGQVDAVYFDVEVLTVGPHALTVAARGSAMADAVRRQVLVEPDGQNVTETVSARFHVNAPVDEPSDETVSKIISIPANNIDGAQSLLVKVYPGFFSQCVEGLDSMLRLPGG